MFETIPIKTMASSKGTELFVKFIQYRISDSNQRSAPNRDPIRFRDSIRLRTKKEEWEDSVRRGEGRWRQSRTRLK